MELKFNGNIIVVSDDSCNLQQVLTRQGLADAKGIAVAVNQEVISRGAWHEKQLQNSDNIIVIKAAQGG